MQNKIVNNNEYKIYNLGPIKNSYNILNHIEDFSNTVKNIFDQSPNNKKPNEIIKFQNIEIKYKSSDNKLIIAKYITKLNDELYNYIMI
jgi:hypothetical protein